MIRKSTWQTLTRVHYHCVSPPVQPNRTRRLIRTVFIPTDLGSKSGHRIPIEVTRLRMTGEQLSQRLIYPPPERLINNTMQQGQSQLTTSRATGITYLDFIFTINIKNRTLHHHVK